MNPGLTSCFSVCKTDDEPIMRVKRQAPVIYSGRKVREPQLNNTPTLRFSSGRLKEKTDNPVMLVGHQEPKVYDPSRANEQFTTHNTREFTTDAAPVTKQSREYHSESVKGTRRNLATSSRSKYNSSAGRYRAPDIKVDLSLNNMYDPGASVTKPKKLRMRKNTVFMNYNNDTETFQSDTINLMLSEVKEEDSLEPQLSTHDISGAELLQDFVSPHSSNDLLSHDGSEAAFTQRARQRYSSTPQFHPYDAKDSSVTPDNKLGFTVNRFSVKRT